MAGGQLYQVKGSKRANTFVAKKKSVRWGKISKVPKSVKTYVKKAVAKAEETKYHDSFSANNEGYTYVSLGIVDNSVSPSAGAAIFPLNQFPATGTSLYNGGTDVNFIQGSDNNQHVGDTITCSNIVVHGKYLFDTDNILKNQQMFRVVVLREEECADRSDLTKISELNVLHTQSDILGFMDMDSIAKLKNLKIVKTKTYKVDSSYGSEFLFNLNIKVNKKLTYIDDATKGLLYKNRYWMLIWSCGESADSESKVLIQSRMYFKDA